jgi:FkbM family methyltransferase
MTAALEKVMAFAEAAVRRVGLYRAARNVYERLFARARYDKKQLARDFYRPFIHRGDLVFDVGANIGKRTSVFLDLGARVVAIEPNPACAETIRMRYSCSSLSVEAAAAGAEPGTARLHISNLHEQSSLGEGWFPKEMLRATIDVPVTTIDALIERYGQPRFVKIDVEGFEEQVLGGMTHPLAQLSFEFHSGALGVAKRCTELVARPGARFNLSWGESMSMAHDEWLDADCMLAEFDRLEAAGVDPMLYGDVYMRA